MRLREVSIKNFRCLADVTVPLDDLTVLIGPNNTGKTAFMDALKLAFRWRGSDVQEADYYMTKASDTPKTCGGLEVVLWFREDSPGEWPEPLVRDLDDCMQSDPVDGGSSIGLRFSSCYSESADAMDTKWEFLAINGQPLVGKATSSTSLGKFLSYVRIDYLSALRDAATEFSPKSQFWGKILRDLKISDKDIKIVKGELAKLNEQLLSADPRLDKVRQSFDGIQKVIRIGRGERAGIEALPLQPWDLMAKSQVVIKDPGSDVAFPLHRYGQGTQSLAVLFLFQAYIDVLFRAISKPEAEAILALEEPEAHLHPQAARALAAYLGSVGGQKIISSHSPHFIQEIPLKSVRMFKRNGSSVKVLYIKRRFEAHLPDSRDLGKLYSNNPKFSYRKGRDTLVVTGSVSERERESLVECCPESVEEIERLCLESSSYITDQELVQAETSAKRMRGEILFANGWFLCEGQSEYPLVQFFANVLGTPLDAEGIAVIDFQNNGSPRLYAKLARAFEIPWVLICDNDSAKDKFVQQLVRANIDPKLIADNVRWLTAGNLEEFLVKNGFAADYAAILDAYGERLTKKQGEHGFEDEIAEKLGHHKPEHVIALIERLRGVGDAARVPAIFATAIKDLVGMVNGNGK